MIPQTIFFSAPTDAPRNQTVVNHGMSMTTSSGALLPASLKTVSFSASALAIRLL